MVYVTGDVHANQRKFVEQIHPCLKSGDSIIIAGDFGFGFWNGQLFSEETFYDWIAEQPYNVLVVDGNHENFDKLGKYPVQDWHNGKVHIIRENLLHLMRGEIYDCIDGGKSLFVFGGGYSLDRPYRIEGKSWWPQEMPNEIEYRYAEEKLKKHGNRVDYIITHTCPTESVQYLSSITRRQIKSPYEELPLNAFLSIISSTAMYEHWYFGHFHLDRELWKNQTVIFNCIRELETGNIIKNWETYEAI